MHTLFLFQHRWEIPRCGAVLRSSDVNPVPLAEALPPACIYSLGRRRSREILRSAGPLLPCCLPGLRLRREAVLAVQPRWYVVQVQGGRERATARLVGAMAPEGLVEECFAPAFTADIKVRGSWYPADRVMFPGYVIAVTSDVEGLRHCLVDVPGFARLLGHRGTGGFQPLSRTDRTLIERLTEPGSRTVANSSAYVVGDRVVVTSGPLMGHEAWITGFNRKKSIAFLRVDHFLGRDSVTGRAGLQILERRGGGFPVSCIKDV